MSVHGSTCSTWRGVLAATALVALAGCGSGAVEPPGAGGDEAVPGTPTEPETQTQTETETETGGGGGGGGGGGDEYSWGLPGGDLSVDAVGFAFNELRAGRCPEDLISAEFATGQLELYRSAIATCSGELATARDHLVAAQLTDHPGDCRVYKAVVSVLEQRPQASVVCPAPTSGGATPTATVSPTDSPTDSPTVSATPGATASADTTPDPPPGPTTDPTASSGLPSPAPQAAPRLTR